jgi:hypothetical protein
MNQVPLGNEVSAYNVGTLYEAGEAKIEVEWERICPESDLSIL